VKNKNKTLKVKNTYMLYDICYHILKNITYTCYIIIHLVEILLYNIKYNWPILCSKSFRRDIPIHIASLSLIATGKKQISVIAITSIPGTWNPIVSNAKTRDRVPADPGQSHPIPGFKCPHQY